MSPDGVERRLAAILSADVVGYSRLMADDEDSTVRTLVRQHRGRVVDRTGDNFLAEFASTVNAVQSALDPIRDDPTFEDLLRRIGIPES